MRFLLITIQSFESAFYGAVGDELARAGHDVAHVTYSRRAAQRLRAGGRQAESLLERIGELPPAAEPEGVAVRYGLPSIRDAYRGDPACDRRSEETCVHRTLAHFGALERLFDELQPEILVSEAGSETL